MTSTAPRPVRGLRVDAVVVDEQIAALHQLAADAPREEAVLEVGRSSASASVHGGPASTGAVATWWIRGVYLWLIGLVIGGMTAHNLLDLARKARSPVPAPPGAPGISRSA